MSYVNDPNDPNYVVPNTVPPIAEAVEPAPNPLRWLWWLLGLLLLGLLLWWLVRSCQPRCESLPANVWTTEQQTTTWNTLHGYDGAFFTDANRGPVLAELQSLCNRRLSGTHLTVNEITGAGAFSGLGEGPVGQVLSLINANNGFCRCR